MHDADRAIGGAFMDVRLAVRHDHHALAVEMPAERVLEPLRCPEPAEPVRLALRGQPVHQVADIPHEGNELGARRRPLDQSPQFVAPASPRHAGRGHGHDGRGEREKGEREEQELPGRRLPPADEGHVVDEHDEAQRPTVGDHRDGRRVDVPAGHADLGGPHGPVRRRGVGGRPNLGAGESAADLRRVVAGPGQQGQVALARGRRHDALVAGDPQEDLAQRGCAARVPVGGQRLAGSRDGERGTQLDVPVEPPPRGFMDHLRRGPREQRQAGDEDEDEPQRSPHVESI